MRFLLKLRSKVSHSHALTLPDQFTPEGDHKNDQWVKASERKTNKMSGGVEEEVGRDDKKRVHITCYGATCTASTFDVLSACV